MTNDKIKSKMLELCEHIKQAQAIMEELKESAYNDAFFHGLGNEHMYPYAVFMDINQVPRVLCEHLNNSFEATFDEEANAHNHSKHAEYVKIVVNDVKLCGLVVKEESKAM